MYIFIYARSGEFILINLMMISKEHRFRKSKHMMEESTVSIR